MGLQESIGGYFVPNHPERKTAARLTGLRRDVEMLKKRRLPASVVSPPSSGGGWGMGRFISVSKSLGAIASGTTTSVNFTGLSVKSNDFSATDSSGSHSSPFTGEHFSVDWTTDAFSININEQGVYLVHRVFTILFFAGFGTPAADFDMEMVMTGSNPTAVNSAWLQAAEAVNIVQNMSRFASAWVMRDTQLFVNEGYSHTQGLQVLQKSGLSTDTCSAGLAIVRLGDVVTA